MYKGVALHMIVAVSSNNVIGYKNALPWKMPADLKYYKNHTWGSPMIMGRKTFDSISQRNQLLPGRHHAVMSRTINQLSSIKGMSVHSSVDDVCEYLLDTLLSKIAYVVGGGSIYDMFLPWVDVIYMTRIHKEFSGDAYLDISPREPRWRLVSEQRCKRDERNEADYTFFVYERRS